MRAGAGTGAVFTYEQVAVQLSAELRRGLWSDGDPLPSEAELARSFGVGRRTVRRALALVERKGLIAKGQGRRSVVRSGMVEAGGASPAGFPAAVRAAGLKQSTRLLWVRACAAGLSEARALDLRVGAEVVAICRLRLLAGRPAVRQVSILPAEVAHRLPLQRLGAQSLYRLIGATLATGVTIGEERISLASLDPEEARDLDLPTGWPTILARRVAHGDNGRPLEYSIAAITSSKIGFTWCGSARLS